LRHPGAIEDHGSGDFLLALPSNLHALGAGDVIGYGMRWSPFLAGRPEPSPVS